MWSPISMDRFKSSCHAEHNSAQPIILKHALRCWQQPFTTLSYNKVQKQLTGCFRNVLEGHGGWVADCAITASCSTAITVAGDDLAVVWDLPTGTCQNVLEGHSDELLSVELTRKGRFAVTGSADGTAKIWDLQAKSAHLQQAHSGRVHGLVVSPDQEKVISFGKHV